MYTHTHRHTPSDGSHLRSTLLYNTGITVDLKQNFYGLLMCCFIVPVSVLQSVGCKTKGQQDPKARGTSVTSAGGHDTHFCRQWKKWAIVKKKITFTDVCWELSLQNGVDAPGVEWVGWCVCNVYWHSQSHGHQHVAATVGLYFCLITWTAKVWNLIYLANFDIGFGLKMGFKNPLHSYRKVVAVFFCGGEKKKLQACGLSSKQLFTSEGVFNSSPFL